MYSSLRLRTEAAQAFHSFARQLIAAADCDLTLSEAMQILAAAGMEHLPAIASKVRGAPQPEPQQGSVTPAPNDLEPASKPTRRSTPAHRLPGDWVPGPELVEWGLREVPELAGERGRTETANFRDYWQAASGQRARKHDWDAAWRTWMRKAASGVTPGSAPTDRRQAALDAKTARALERARARDEGIQA